MIFSVALRTSAQFLHSGSKRKGCMLPRRFFKSVRLRPQVSGVFLSCWTTRIILLSPVHFRQEISESGGGGGGGEGAENTFFSITLDNFQKK